MAGFRLACERYALGAITHPDDGYGHIKVMIFTLVIGFTVGVIGRNGGTAGMVRIVTGKWESQRRSALTAWLAGLVVFFDDYANTMIVGPTMRSVFDRVRISRAKLAYIVDSTAAPVASLALIGTWVGAEIGFIQKGIDQLAQTGAPVFLVGADGQTVTGMQAFLYSLPYRFYPILALVMVFLVAFTGRDFGPMKRSQRQAAARREDAPDASPESAGRGNGAPARWWLGFFPIAALVAGTLAVLIATGTGSTDSAAAAIGESWWQRGAAVLRNADSYLSIFYGAIFSALVAVVLTLFARACPTRAAIDAGLEGMARMFPAIVILVFAWALSAVLEDLHVSDVAVAHLRAMEFPPAWLPLAVFISAAVVSFATGSSWGTMGILCPATVSIAANLAGSLDPAVALHLFYASVGSVLAGAIFGDHCSPISDTTVLSSIAAGCSHEEHVWTQIPYAVLTAVAAMAFGDVMCTVFHQPWYLGLLAGTAFLWLFVMIVGRRAKLTPETMEA
jgi:Na+/H+ antiporter NhaC